MVVLALGLVNPGFYAVPAVGIYRKGLIFLACLNDAFQIIPKVSGRLVSLIVNVAEVSQPTCTVVLFNFTVCFGD